ncbi:MAG: glycosyltransferase family protein [Rhodospirillales bacterium]
MSAGGANSRRVFFYVQHLLGVGHVRRAAALTRAMAAAGLDVTVAQGGHDVPGTDFPGAQVVKLPAARAADATFKDILDETGVPVSDAWKAARREALLAAFDAARTDVLLIEMYPFGRRMFSFELEPLLARAHRFNPRPAAVCSLRDILVKKTKPGRDAETAETARRWFDKVLVHGDPAFIPLEDTFSETARIADLIEYTGLIAERGAPASAPAAGAAAHRKKEVIVSAGGGVAAESLFRAALAALPETAAAGWDWRFLCGPNLPSDTVEALRRGAPANAVFEPNREDFRELLAGAGLSVSQAGYNTVTDVMLSRVPAVLVPFKDEGESEQLLRARRLDETGLMQCAENGETDFAGLARSIDRALTRGPADAPAFNINGAETSARIIAELAAALTAPGRG